MVHSTAVVRLHNGTYHPIALIECDVTYTTLCRNLANCPSIRTPDHFDTRWEKWQYVKQQTTRLLNKLLGRPPTPETAVLAAMVSHVPDAARVWLGNDYSVTAEVLSSPDRIRPTEEEVNDVFDYLGIKNLMDDEYVLTDMYTTAAAYAGYGEGLCSTYIDVYEREREECDLPY